MSDVRRPLVAVVEEIKAWVDMTGKTQEGLAKMLGQSQSSISRLLGHKTRRFQNWMIRLCKIAAIPTHKPFDLAEFPDLSAALARVMNGSKVQERAIVDLIRAAELIGSKFSDRSRLPTVARTGGARAVRARRN